LVSVVVCVGSSCYVRGSETVAETLERLIKQEGLAARVEITGAFCMDRCSMGVSVRVGARVFNGITPTATEEFFYSVVLPEVALAVGA
jgi:NADH:ubiquinone oxidoreductase subunit E